MTTICKASAWPQAGYAANGVPISLQIVGQRFDDCGVLQLARPWERMRPAQRRWPTPPGG